MNLVKFTPVLTLLITAHAFAQTHDAPQMGGRLPLGDGAIMVVIYGSLGIALAIAAFKIIDLVTPGNLAEEITVKQNNAVAIFTGLFVLGVCIIIAAVVGS